MERKQKNKISKNIFLNPSILINPVVSAAKPKFIKIRFLEKISRNVSKSPAIIKHNQIYIFFTSSSKLRPAYSLQNLHFLHFLVF